MDIVSLADTPDEIAALWVELAESQRTYGSNVLPAANRTRIRQAIAHRTVEDGVLVAREDATVLGFVMFCLEETQFEQDVTRGLVENLYVVPGRRSEGIGRRLLAAAEAALADRGADVVALEAMALNRRARQFYRALGYEERRIEFEKPLGSDTPSKGDE